MKHVILSAAIVVGLAAQGHANEQLAQSIGVEVGVYTSSELVQMQAALADNNQALFNHLQSSFNGQDVVTTGGGISDGHAQFAASLGLDPGTYTASELIQIRTARENGDAATERFLTGSAEEIISTQSGGISAGARQLATTLGVDPADYTLSELTRMYISAYD
ncbi:hypothetical protein [Jannaschia sp. CCS1]|uniref:hypothetical protein n=1 Tax=Jannaschia sp. (strain CCS1) TaxID=290400 RepID=UPI0002D7ADE1|nr:hypothetical protein [Jannaschia sp. CCS1]